MTVSNHQSDSLKIIEPLKFCVFDLETTGGNHEVDKIIEIGMVKVHKLQIVESKNILINPEIKIPEFIQKLTNISQQDVQNSPKIEDVIQEIIDFLDDSILVAHNTSFDVPFLNSVLRRLGHSELSNKSLCTNLMTKYLIPNLMNSNLNYMSRIFNIQHHKAHRALDDAMATAKLLINYLTIFTHKNIKKVNHLYYPRNRFELDRANFKRNDSKELIFEKINSMRSPGLITLKGNEGVILYALPYQGGKSDFQIIQDKINQLDWSTLTIRLHGPVIETFIHLNNHFNKLEESEKNEIIKYLWSSYLPGNEFDASLANFKKEKMDKIDFFITHHLVPEQLVIYPLKSLHPKSELIFRYPGHKKKLLQYINSKSSKLKNNRLAKIHFHPQLKNFIDHYLYQSSEESKEIFFFSKKLATKDSSNFYHMLDNYIEDYPNPYDYPREFI